MTSTAQKNVNEAYGPGRRSCRTIKKTIATIFASYRGTRGAEENRHMRLGTLVLPERIVRLDVCTDIIDEADEEPVRKIPWGMTEVGTVIQIEEELPANVPEFNRLVRVMIPSGIGWCFFDEIKTL